MKNISNILSRIALSLGLAVVLAFTMWSVKAKAADEKPDSQHSKHMTHIKTQADAEALKPGDSIAIVCNSCKNVMIHEVANDDSHIKMMTIGTKYTCPECGGSVEVVGTGKGTGKNEEVKFVCSKCGDDAMFACASKPGSGSMKDMGK